MTPPPTVLLDTGFEDWLQPVLDTAQLTEEGLEQLARSTGALQRRRSLRSARQLLALLLLYVISDASLRDIAGFCALQGRAMTDEAVRQRFHRAEAFVAAVLMQLFAADLDRPEVRRVLLCDGTLLTGPGAKGAELRVHTLMELGGDGLVQAEVTDARCAESLCLFDLHPGDLVLADSEFSRRTELTLLGQAGVDVLVRFRPSSWPGKPIARWESTLLALSPHAVTTFEETLPSGQRVWVHALALSAEQASEARRKKRRRHNKKHGGQPRAQTLWLAGFVLVATTLSPEVLSARDALNWYRRRWQIELLFKRQKSLLGLARLPSRGDSALSRVVVWTKLLYAWIVERSAPDRQGLPPERDRSVWRAWRWARETLRVQLWLPLLGWRSDEVLLVHALAERKRQRRTQCRAHDILEALIA